MEVPQIPKKSPRIDFEGFYFSLLFEPGIFTNQMITKAIQLFKGSLEQVSISHSISKLKKEILREIQEQVSEM
jgi:hypothetical protein